MSSLLRRFARSLPLVGLTLIAPAVQAGVSSLWRFDEPTLSFLEGSIYGDGSAGNTQNLVIGAGSYYGRTNGYVRSNIYGPDMTKPWSVSTWFRSDADAGLTDTLFSWYDSSKGECILHSFASVRFSFEVGGKTFIWRTPANLLNQKWHHMTVSSDGGGEPFRLFCDGVELLNPLTGSTAVPPFNEAYFIVGAAGDHSAVPARNWDGWIDDTGILDEAATPESEAALTGLRTFGIGLSDYSSISALLKSVAGTQIYLKGAYWEKTAGGLTGGVSTTGGTLAGGDAYVVTGADASGLKMSLPPATGASLSFSPSSFTGSVGYGQKVSLPAQVGNASADRPLPWQLSGLSGQMPTLENSARLLKSNLNTLLGLLTVRANPGTYLQPDGSLYGSPYSYGGNSLTFYDPSSYYSGRLSLYDDGGAVHQEKTYDPSGNAVQGVVRYTTLFRPDFNVTTGDFTNVSSLTVSGTAGYQQGATITSETMTVRGLTWKVWYYSQPGYGLQVIRHIFLTPATDDISLGYLGGSNGEGATLTHLPASCRLHHIWFTTPGSSITLDATIPAFVRSFLEMSHAPAGFIGMQPSSGTVAPASTADVQVVLDSTGLPPGSYDGSFALAARGEEPGATLATAHLEVAAPQFTAAAPPLTLPVLTGELRHADKILLTALDGFAFGAVTTTSGAGWLRAVPSENRPGEVDLYIDPTGLTSGTTYTTTVTITAGHTVQTVPVTIRVEPRQITRLIADPLRPRVYVLTNPGTTSSVINKVQALDSTTGKLVREVDADKVTDIALSPDSTRIYGVQNSYDSVPRIVWIDLQSMTLSPTSLPAATLGSGYAISQLVAGPGHVLYFISLTDRRLVVQNADTGALIQQLNGPAAGTTFGSICLSADGTTLLANPMAAPDSSGSPDYSRAPVPAFTRYAIQPDGSLTALSGDLPVLVAAPNTVVRLSVTADGRYVTSADRVYEVGKPASRSVSFPANPWGMSPGGEFVVGNTGLFSKDAGRVIADLNASNLGSSLTVAVTPEGRIFSSNSGDPAIYDPRAALGDAGAGYFISPVANATTSVPASFRWLPVDGCREYHLYASKDPAALQGTVPAAGTEIAVSPRYFIDNPLATTMAAGETWYWRVDAAAPQGRAGGAVNHFTISTLATDRESIEVTTVRGCRAQPAEIRILPAGDSAAATWTATSDGAWLTLDSASGSTADPVKVKINTTLLPNYAGTAHLTLSSGGATRVIPVNVTAVAIDSAVVDLQTASDFNTAFALVRSVISSNNFTSVARFQLVRLDPATGTLLESRTVDSLASFLRLSPDQSTLAVQAGPQDGSYGSSSLEFFDTATLQRVTKLTSHDSTINGSSSSPGATLGPDGKALFGRRLLHWPDYQALGTMDYGTASNRATTAFSADGKYLFGTAYNTLYKIDATSPTLGNVKSVQVPNLYSSSGAIRTSKDGRYFGCSTFSFDNDLNITGSYVSSTGYGIQALNRAGTLAVTPNGLYHFPSLRPLVAFPAYTRLPAFDDRNSNFISAINPDQDSVPKFTLTSYRDQLVIDQSMLKPGYADGTLVGTSSITLSWTDVPKAGNYRVYLSTSLGAIELAQPGDASELGTTFGTSWAVKTPLQPNTTYYWKLILEGGAGYTSSPEWSFHTSDFLVSEGSVQMAGPLNCAPLTHDIQLTAPAGRNWSVSSTSPWLTSSSSGTGSGTITLTVNPAGLAAGTLKGSASLLIGGETLTIPVNFTSFTYHVVRMVPDQDRAYAHLLVAPGTSGSYSGTMPLYLIKIDLRTRQVVDSLDLGLTTVDNEYFVFALHPEDNRVYLYHSSTASFYGYNRNKYVLERTLAGSDMPGFTGTYWTGALTSAGPGRMALAYPTTGVFVYSTVTGELISSTPRASYSTLKLVSAPGGKRIYAADTDYYFVPPISYDVSDTGIITPGPSATTVGNDYASYSALGVTPDGQKTYYQGLFYNKDLTLLGKPAAAGRMIMPTGNGSLLIMSGNNGNNFASADGTLTYPPIPFGDIYNMAADPLGYRLLYISSNAPRWAEALTPASGAVPQVSGAGWMTYGQTTWTPDSSRPGVLTSKRLRDDATNASGAEAFLAFTSPAAGTIRFDWRSLTTAGEKISFRMDDTERFNIGGTSGWQSVQISVVPGSRLVWDYLLAYNAARDPNSSAELRNITFTPASGGATVSAGISPTADSDGDGFTDLLEAALGTDPASAASRPVAGLVMNGGAVSFVYERPASSTYQYTVQVSQELVTWQDLPAESASVTAAAAASPGGAARLRVTMPLSATGSKSFTRLKVADAGAK